jgi:hypothetical protein
MKYIEAQIPRGCGYFYIGRYPYTSPGGYLSEPEPALYDSDIGYSAKYATLDRRRIKNKENDFTTSTLPRSR